MPTVRPRQARQAKQRMAAFSAKEAEKVQEDKFLASADWDAQLVKRLAMGTIKAHRCVRDAYDEFGEAVLGWDPGHAAKYFAKGGPLPSIVEVRQLLKYLATTRQLRMTTLTSYLSDLWGAVKYNNRPFDKHAQLQHYTFLVDHIGPEYLDYSGVPKPVAYTHDCEAVIAALMSPRFLSEFRTMREVLKVLVVSNLLTDLCGRIGELLPDRATFTDEDCNILMDKILAYVLTWGRTQFTVRRDGPNGSIRVSSTVKVQGMKGTKGMPDLYKALPLSSCEPHMALQDSTRLLYCLARLEGHLEVDLPYDQLQKLNPGEHGMIVPIKKSSENILVLSKSATDLSPLWQSWLGNIYAKLAKHLGLKHGLSSRMFRRGIAYKLNQCTDIDTRKQLMGHFPGSKIFHKYMSKIAQVDVQGLLRGLPQRDVTLFSSILHCSIPDAPKVVSRAGQEKIFAAPAYQSARLALDLALDAALAMYYTLYEAKAAEAPEYDAYLKARRQVDNLTKKLMTAELKKEMQSYIERQPPEMLLAVLKSSSTPEIPAVNLQESRNEDAAAPYEVDGPESLLHSNPKTNFAADKTQDTDDSDADEADIIADDREAAVMACIDPALLALTEQEDLPMNEAFDHMIVDSSTRIHHDDIDNDDDNGHAQDRDSNVRSVGACQSTVHETEPFMPDMQSIVRQHGVMSPAEIRAEWCPRPTIADDLYANIASGNISGPELDATLCRFFSTALKLNYLPPHMMPVPGTLKCLHCGEDLGRFAFDHMRSCTRKVALQEEDPWPLPDLQSVRQPCKYRVNANQNKSGRSQGRPCNKTFENVDAWVTHTRVSHLVGPSTMICRYESCIYRVPANTNVVMAGNLMRVHALQAHAVNTFNTDDTLRFCEYCEEWLRFIPFSEEETKHYAGHLATALSTVDKIGYNGWIYSNRPLIPRVCIFCIHNADLSCRHRLDMWEQGAAHQKHIWAHINHMKAPAWCPASGAGGADHPTCSSEQLFSDVQLANHLREVHCVSLEDTYRKVLTGGRGKRLRAGAPQSTGGPNNVHIDAAQVGEVPTPAGPTEDHILDDICPNTPKKAKSSRDKKSK